MIKTFIFVEDGSVDLDELKNSVGDGVLVLSYRRGATPPAIQQPREPVSQKREMEKLESEIFSLWEKLVEIGNFALKMCDEDGCKGDESVGLPACEMWREYKDERGCVLCGCYLKNFILELKKRIFIRGRENGQTARD